MQMIHTAMGQGRGGALVIGVLVALHCCGLLASAVTWTVGDSQGWTIGPNYTTWAAGKTFTTGDVLFFPYTQNEHDVVVVPAAGYDACSAANAISTFTAGNTNVTLNATGTQYFLCGFPGHCTAGMKLAVTVVAAAAAAPTRTPATPAPTSASTPSSVGTPTPTPSSVPASASSPSNVGTPTPTPASVPSPASAPVPSPANAAPPTSPPTPSSTPASPPTTPASASAPSPQNAGTSPTSAPTPSSSTPAAQTPPSPPSGNTSPPPAPPPSSAPSLPSAASLAATAILCLSSALFAF